MLTFVTCAYSSAAVGDDVTLQVLVESEQMRREADDIGPRVELDHWKKRMAKFNCLLDEIKRPAVTAVVGVLNVARSKLLAVSRPRLVCFKLRLCNYDFSWSDGSS